VRNPQEFAGNARYALLFDPQTAGGLLASVPADRVADCIARLHQAGYGSAAVIGSVLAQGDALEPVLVRA